MKGILRGLTESRTGTDPGSSDPRLRGRTYAIPFETVWQAATQLAGGGIRGWRLISADDQSGVIVAETRSLLPRSPGDVEVRIGLDENAQTRVDLASVSRNERGDLGRGRRAIGRFLRSLDGRLHADARSILDPTRTPEWHRPS